MFIYQDAKGIITARRVENVSESEVYIQGICSSAGALRTFRKDRILDDEVDESNINKKLEHWLSINPKLVTTARSHHRRLNPTGAPEVCFTGFKKNDKAALIELAGSSGMVVRTSVTSNLDFLCCGYNAGPKKIEKSRHQGVVVLSEPQFKTMLETGEIPEDA
jgi:NAD-dependent DNA ligase